MKSDSHHDNPLSLTCFSGEDADKVDCMRDKQNQQTEHSDLGISPNNEDSEYNDSPVYNSDKDPTYNPDSHDIVKDCSVRLVSMKFLVHATSEVDCCAFIILYILDHVKMIIRCLSQTNQGVSRQ